MTEWRAIPGFESYEASELGEIRPVKPRYTRGRGTTIKPWVEERHGRQALRLSLHVDGVRTKHFVHRLVCLAFHGVPPPELTDCCHLDDNSLNNRASNLAWGTHSENIEEQWEKRKEMEVKLADALGELPCYNGPDRRSDVPF